MKQWESRFQATLSRLECLWHVSSARDPGLSGLRGVSELSPLHPVVREHLCGDATWPGHRSQGRFGYTLLGDSFGGNMVILGHSNMHFNIYEPFIFLRLFFERQRKISHPLVQSQRDYNGYGWAKPASGARNSIWAAHVGDRGSSTWAALCSLPRNTSRESVRSGAARI